MPTSCRWVFGIGLLAFVLVAPPVSDGQPNAYNLKYNSGQTVQPIFEGWSRNPDGGFTMHFGYLNRNWVEEVIVPVGSENGFEPGDIDAGQPGVFSPRVHRKMFSVSVPSDFGNQRLAWNLTVRGETLRAEGWLEPSWEIDPVYGGRTLSDEETRNTPPSVEIEAPSAIAVGQQVTLTAHVDDDGLPTPRDPEAATRRAAVGQENPPTLQKPDGEPEPPNNVPNVPSGRGGSTGPRIQGLRVDWTVWRGPASVAFESASTVAVEDGRASLQATFTAPGEYVLRAKANDGRLTAEEEVVLSVTPR